MPEKREGGQPPQVDAPSDSEVREETMEAFKQR